MKQSFITSLYYFYNVMASNYTLRYILLGIYDIFMISLSILARDTTLVSTGTACVMSSLGWVFLSIFFLHFLELISILLFFLDLAEHKNANEIQDLKFAHDFILNVSDKIKIVIVLITLLLFNELLSGTYNNTCVYNYKKCEHVLHYYTIYEECSDIQVKTINISNTSKNCLYVYLFICVVHILKLVVGMISSSSKIKIETIESHQSPKYSNKND
jgi:hypothetical protein